jgi:hypothetical protein
MRHALLLALGLIALGVSAQLAAARPATCATMARSCADAARGSEQFIIYCKQTYGKCMQDGSWGSYGSPGTIRKE